MAQSNRLGDGGHLLRSPPYFIHGAAANTPAAAELHLCITHSPDVCHVVTDLVVCCVQESTFVELLSATWKEKFYENVLSIDIWVGVAC